MAILNVYRRQTATTTTTSKYRIKIKYRNDNDKTHVINTHSLISTQNTVRSVVRSASGQTHNASDYIGGEAVSASQTTSEHHRTHTTHTESHCTKHLSETDFFNSNKKSRRKKKLRVLKISKNKIHLSSSFISLSLERVCCVARRCVVVDATLLSSLHR